MCAEYRLADGPCMEQRKTQHDRICHYGKERHMKVARYSHRIDEHCIYSDADHNEKALECQGKNRSEIVRSDISPLLVRHSCKRDRRYGAVNVYLYHSSV